MRTVDTSVWIEWLVESDLGRQIGSAIPVPEECIVPTIVQLELAKWLARETSEEEADLFIAYTQTCRVVPLTTPIALAAAELCRRHRLSTADAVVYATSLESRAGLLTCDAHFQGLEGVSCFPKTGS